MELPQSRPFGTAQAKKATHDFLSLCTRSSLQQDPRPSSHGGFLKTQNFFVSLGEEKNGPNEDKSENIDIEKPPLAVSCPSVVEHQLPGGFGAYNISHIAYSNQRVAKSEEDFIAVAQITNNDGNDENSNCDSYTGNGFILWHESATGKGSTRNELSRSENVLRESRIKVGQWPLDQPSQSSSNRRSSVSPLSSLGHGQKNQSFTDMIKSEKGPGSMAEDEEELNLIKENSSSQKGELRVKVDGKSSDQKANTPRSKHSATEQRRRCKINDRFQMLRELIPHGDQKRDKASFLLEVIEYIQFLQEKVSRYEGPYSKWNCEPAKITPWRNGHGPAESLINQSGVSNGVTGPVLMFGTRHDEKPTNALSNIQRNPQIPAEYVVTNAINFNAVDQQSGMTKKAGSISSALLPDVYAPVRQNGAVHPSTTRLPSDGENGSLAHLHLLQNGNSASEPTSTDKLKDQELTLESGTISISSIYSQGLLNTLTQAFQSSGVDLSHANISVEVDVGKGANNHQNTQKPIKVAEVPSSTQSLLRARVESTIEESDHAVKRLKAT